MAKNQFQLVSPAAAQFEFRSILHHRDEFTASPKPFSLAAIGLQL
jgi:hypothetical protein